MTLARRLRVASAASVIGPKTHMATLLLDADDDAPLDDAPEGGRLCAAGGGGLSRTKGGEGEWRLAGESRRGGEREAQSVIGAERSGAGASANAGGVGPSLGERW